MKRDVVFSIRRSGRRFLGMGSPALLAATCLLASARATVVHPVFTPGDSTAAIQAALDTPSADELEVVLDAHVLPWVSDHLEIHRDSVTLRLEPGATLQAISGGLQGDQEHTLIRMANHTGVTISGYGATLRMLGEKHGTSGVYHAIAVFNSSNVRIEGLLIDEAGGDGVYITGTGTNQDTNFSRDIYLVDLSVVHAMRNGFSLISGKDIFIENCSVSGTNGADAGPWAGIDLEPNNATQRLENVRVRRCTFHDNAGRGIMMSLHHGGWAMPNGLDVGFENCWVKNAGKAGVYLKLESGDLGEGFLQPLGSLYLTNVVVENAGNGPGTKLNENAGFNLYKQDNGLQATLTNCIARRALAKPSTNYAPFRVEGTTLNLPSITYGGIEFVSCVVYDTINRPFFRCHVGSNPYPVYTGLTGEFSVINPFAATTYCGPNQHGNDIQFTWYPSNPASTVNVTFPDAIGGESGPDTLMLRFKRVSQTITFPLAIDYTVGGTATNRDDYTFLHGMAIIPAGANGRAYTVFPRADGITTEGTETIVVDIPPLPDFYTVGAPSSATGTIIDDS